MTESAARIEPRPAGLGGWLWPVTWATAALPVLLTASVAASLPAFIEYLRQSGNSLYPEDIAWAYRAYGLNVLLTLVSWWWATRWFARDPRLPRQGPLVLFALGLLCMVLAAFARHDPGDTILAASVLGVAIAAFFCVRWSKRIRNTLVTGALPAHTDEFDAVVFGGPRDWSRGYWLLPGALLHAIFGLVTEWTVFAEVASQALPPPYPEGPPHDGCTRSLGFSTMGTTYSANQIETYREALTISHAAGLLLLGALIGFVRGARWTVWAAIAALALAMAAPLRITLGEWCTHILNHTDFPGMWREWAVVLILVIVGTGFRRWSSPTRQA